MSRKKLNIKLKVGLRIRQLREEKGLTQEKLSELSRIDYKHIQYLESKKPSAIKVDSLEKICNSFQISFQEFFNSDIFKD